MVDPAFVLNATYMNKVILGVQQGYNVTNLTNLDERKFKRSIAQAHSNEEISFLIIGPSQIMTASKEAFPDTCSMLNLGMSACRIEDYIAMYEICKEYNISYKNIIIAIDPSLFNGSCEEKRWESNSLYYYRFFGKKDKSQISKIYAYIKNLFSLSYFQESWKMLMSSGLPEVKYTDIFENELSTYDANGSLTYGKKYRETPQSETDSLALYWEHGTFMNYTEISHDKKEQFEQLINALKSDSTKIYFAFCPYHPLFYPRLTNGYGFSKAVDYLYNYAQENDIKIIGSYNPNEVGFDNTFYYDAAHARKVHINNMIREEFCDK